MNIVIDGKKQWMKRNTLKEKQELQKANVSFQKHAVDHKTFQYLQLL